MLEKSKDIIIAIIVIFRSIQGMARKFFSKLNDRFEIESRDELALINLIGMIVKRAWPSFDGYGLHRKAPPIAYSVQLYRYIPRPGSILTETLRTRFITGRLGSLEFHN